MLRTMRNRPAVDARPEARAAIEAVLERFGPGALRVATNAGVRLVHLRGSEAYRDRSRVLRRLASGVDDWPVPPAGLFVVEERTVYLRSTSPMTVVHEAGHALDCALGGGVYHSGTDPKIRRAFAEARAFVTPYAATALDEYFAECVRAFVQANDARSPWPAANRERLQRVDPAMFEIVGGIFARLAAGEQMSLALEVG